MLNCKLHTHSPPVYTLPVHLPGYSTVIITGPNIQPLQQREEHSRLTAYFVCCQVDELAKTLTYLQMPTYFKYVKEGGEVKKWARRTVGKSETVNGIVGVKKCKVLTKTLNKLVNTVKSTKSVPTGPHFVTVTV